MLYDTHAHLDDDRFTADLPAVLERARNVGVVCINAIATSAASSLACVRLAQTHPLLRASVGIHPNHLTEEPPTAWDDVVALAGRPEVVAIGETGLDRHWDKTPFPQQEEAFARHLELARRVGLPVVIHCREAEADAVRMLRQAFDRHGPIRGVLHSYTGTADHAATGLALGLHVSFAGMLTYKTAGDLRAVAATIPLERLLVETDCPYLAPVPQRGKRNEPAFVAHTAALLAELHGISDERVRATTTANGQALFRRLVGAGLSQLPSS